MSYSQTTHGITIEVDVEYIPQAEHGRGPGAHVWAYHIRMVNGSEVTVQLRTRHWDITDGQGRTQVVDGEGVVGETPVLHPGEAYRYASGCPLNTPSGSMSGWYMFERGDGSWLKVIIPAFSLDVPDANRVLN
ncbi:MAG: Co2+/Mg2+ efflux protein ApaG [Asticcacaulis sp.]